MASAYVTKGALTEFHSDTGSTSYAEKISYGSTQTFTIRASGASGLTTGFTTSSTDFTTPPWARGIEIYTAITAVASGTSGAAFLTIEVKPKDLAGGGGYMVGGNASSAKWLGDSTGGGSSAGTTGASRLSIYPGVVFSSGYQYNGILPQVFKVDSIPAGSSMNFTWAVFGRFIP